MRERDELSDLCYSRPQLVSPVLPLNSPGVLRVATELLETRIQMNSDAATSQLATFMLRDNIRHLPAYFVTCCIFIFRDKVTVSVHFHQTATMLIS